MQENRILVVEDEKIIALDLRRRLEKAGYIVCAMASTAEEAIALVSETNPSLILMDIMLGGDMDGIDAAKIIRDRFHIPLIFLTAYADDTTLSRAKEADPLGYILKPFKDQELCTTIDIALYKHSVEQRLIQQEKWVSSILNSVEEGIIATSIGLRIEFMNPVAEELLGITMKEAHGKPIDQIFRVDVEKSNNIALLPTQEMCNKAFDPILYKDVYILNAKNQVKNIDGTTAVIQNVEGSVTGIVVSIRDISELKRMTDQIYYQSHYDTLTGLHNRKSFTAKLDRLIQDAKRDVSLHNFLYLDLDNFKIINDTCGHDAGDQLLMQATTIIKTVVRTSDTCGRLGGDEFGILLENADNDRAFIIANRLHDRFRQHRFLWGKNSFQVNASIGLIPITENSLDLYSVLAAADDACYVAKEEGGNRIQVYATSDNKFTKRRGEMEWIGKLNDALEKNYFVLYFQPIVPFDPASKEQAKGEILIRMKEENGKIIPPISFLPAAESYRMMPEIDRWVILNTLKAVNASIGAGKDINSVPIISINLSGASLDDDNLFLFIKDAIQEFQLPANLFCFEITETVAMSNKAKATQFINDLKKLGCTFALDDFGSGFSSFAYLKKIPADYLKIDGSLVKDIITEPVNIKMIQAINDLGHALNMKTIAEFVSSQEIFDTLAGIHVDYAQGYHISEPKPLSVFFPE